MEWRNGSVGLINVGESLGRVWISNRCWCMWWVELARGVCVCVCVCVCVSHMVQWYVQSISDREVAGSIPDDYGRTRLSSLSRTLLTFLSFSWVVTNSQCMPEYVVWCACVEKNGKMKNRDSLARKKSLQNSCVVDTRLKIVAVNSSALQAVEWCNPSTSCYV